MPELALGVLEALVGQRVERAVVEAADVRDEADLDRLPLGGAVVAAAPPEPRRRELLEPQPAANGTRPGEADRGDGSPGARSEQPVSLFSLVLGSVTAGRDGGTPRRRRGEPSAGRGTTPPRPRRLPQRAGVSVPPHTANAVHTRRQRRAQGGSSHRRMLRRRGTYRSAHGRRTFVLNTSKLAALAATVAVAAAPAAALGAGSTAAKKPSAARTTCTALRSRWAPRPSTRSTTRASRRAP